MTHKQEDALYEFILNRKEPFNIKEVTAFVRSKDGTKFGHLSTEIVRLIKAHRLAFALSSKKWITRAGCFTGARFVIRPSKDEIANGILIPGHRFAPFGNPTIQPKEYKCFWKGIEMPKDNTEASPDELAPYYSLFGDEFLPQLIARENEKNEEAYNDSFYDDPPEVSIKTLNFTTFYRETGFVPGDYIIVELKDWREAVFEIERCPKGNWNTETNAGALKEWQNVAESAFYKSFETLGADCSIEEQIAWAYYFGGQRMMDVPAFPADEFLFEVTDKIEMVPFGIETRYWYAGKEIPDFTALRGIQTQSDQTPIERVLTKYDVPISEFVIQAYIYDALHRKETDLKTIIERIVPSPLRMGRWHFEYLASYIIESVGEYQNQYSIFTDKRGAPLRQKAGELHTAVIELCARLKRGDFDPSWLPTHTFIILSQIQTHAAAVMEDLSSDMPIGETEAASIDGSLDGMTETFDEIKESVERSVENYRNSNISLVRPAAPPELTWRMIQLGIGGTDVWRRLLIPQTTNLFELHKLIQAMFEWKSLYPYNYSFDIPCKETIIDKEKNINQSLTIEDLMRNGYSEINYEYGSRWIIKVIIMEVHNAGEKEIPRCVDGENAPPPERVDGPVRFRRLISAIDSAIDEERNEARFHLGFDFNAKNFDVKDCNRRIESVITVIGKTGDK